MRWGHDGSGRSRRVAAQASARSCSALQHRLRSPMVGVVPRTALPTDVVVARSGRVARPGRGPAARGRRRSGRSARRRRRSATTPAAVGSATGADAARRGWSGPAAAERATRAVCRLAPQPGCPSVHGTGGGHGHGHRLPQSGAVRTRLGGSRGAHQDAATGPAPPSRTGVTVVLPAAATRGASAGGANGGWQPRELLEDAAPLLAVVIARRAVPCRRTQEQRPPPTSGRALPSTEGTHSNRRPADGGWTDPPRVRPCTEGCGTARGTHPGRVPRTARAATKTVARPSGGQGWSAAGRSAVSGRRRARRRWPRGRWLGRSRPGRTARRR